MYANLWFFLIALVPFLIVVVITVHKRSMKQLDIEVLKIEKSNLFADLEEAINKKLDDQLSRIEVLETIVTEKSNDLKG